jgi:hypothetical protein
LSLLFLVVCRQVEFAAPNGEWVRGMARIYVRLGGYFLVQQNEG